MIQFKITFTKDGFQKTSIMSGYGVTSMMLVIIKENYEAIISEGFEISKNDRPINHLIACFPSLYRPVKGSYPCIWELKARPQWSKVKEDLDLL
jgi:hypothetical protein